MFPVNIVSSIFQIIEKLLEDKKSAKEELDNANEKIKAQQKEKDGKKYSLCPQFHFIS